MNVIAELVKTNKSEYNYLKLAEELAELNTEVLKRVTKGDNEKGSTDQEIIDEIGDVLIRLDIITQVMNIEEAVADRILYKLGKYQKFIEENKYIGTI